MGQSREEYNAYMRQYMLDRYKKKRQEAIEFLGGKCITCGTTEDLEFDHVDSTTKTGDTGKLWSYSAERFWEEIKKCQLLCAQHHIDKTYECGDNKGKKRITEHGTYGMYRHRACRCDLCRKAATEYRRERRHLKQERHP